MLDHHTRCITRTGRSLRFDGASHEPSHIHIIRPSRALRSDAADHRITPETRASLPLEDREQAGDWSESLVLDDLQPAGQGT
jgi:hypothetical protein